MREIDQVFECEEALDQLEQELLQRYLELSNDIDRQQRRPLKAAWKALKTYRFDQIVPEHLPSSFVSLIPSYQQCYERLVEQWERAQKLFDEAFTYHLQVLSQAVHDPRFREAVLWQNMDAALNGLDSFLRHYADNSFNHRRRKYIYLVTKYLTRYCAKNDSIGFFGPVGWAQWQEGSDVALSVRPGSQLLSQRNVYFETWGIDMLGELLAQDTELRPWARPRPLPSFHQRGSQLWPPFGHPISLSALEATVFAACDGQRSAREIAQHIVQVDNHITAADIYAALEKLHDQKCLCWTFEVSMEDWYPERSLRHLLSDIQPDELRQRASERLDLLEQKRAAISAAAGNDQQLADALQALNQTFSECTHQHATRMAGEMYAARTLVYEDCQRDVLVTLGLPLRQALEQPLLLLMKSARWFTAEVAQRYAVAYRAIYSDLVKKTGSARVNFAVFWSWIQPLMDAGSVQAPIHEVVQEFQRRWAHILQLPDGQSQVHYTCAELQPQIERYFAAAAPGWRTACYHSPDILISAADPAAISRGEYALVLGEFHQALNTMDTIALVGQHSDPDVLIQAFRSDLPDPLIIPCFPRHIMQGKRTQLAFSFDKDWRLVFGADTAGYDPRKALLYGDLILEERDGQLLVSTHDGVQQFPLLHVLEYFLSLLVCDLWKPLPAARHTPRISIDRLVVCRESWRFSLEELPFLACSTLIEEYTEVRRWRREYSLPRFLFVRIPGERKPVYCDLASPISAQILVKGLRSAQMGQQREQTVVFTEMLPDVEHCWLMDAQNNHYTSELRMVVVDRAGLGEPDPASARRR
ncbi:hypothetical protein KDH_23820 [Dictyobacter sp. S3.2.2.5]|uniref:Lantibiotic dehydratase N-terminal domain-containing protein n=2 Tax=Dictyobacter halimunensis TaxID=3026934 RepID=A0ABQ6FPP0_9CHLR|nr:hypothetical protein KDH_23820 [Dictyobacter sp. S3.2.2.5]